MEYRVISLPPFRAAASGLDTQCDFAPGGILMQFDAYFSQIQPEPRDDFRPRDFLYYDEAKGGMIWMWALAEGMDDGGNEIVNFDGGYYVTYAYKDGDAAENDRLYRGALQYIQDSPVLELDVRPDHYAMGHIITPHRLIEAQGWAQMETFIPVRMKA